MSAAEVDKFRQLQRYWWDPTGPLRTLHMLNPVRVGYVNEMCRLHLGKPLGSGINILDVGCGGGVLSESLGRLGAAVRGVDACAESLQVAQERLQMAQNAALDVTFVHSDVGNMTGEYDVVVVSEVVEHVEEPSQFLAACSRLVRPGGIAVVTTMDKSLGTLVSHVFLAEYVMGLLPPGTHDWAKFIPPADVRRHAQQHGVDEVSLQHVWATPSLMTSLATKSCYLTFSLSPTCKSGHFFWTGKKRTEQKGV